MLSLPFTKRLRDVEAYNSLRNIIVVCMLHIHKLFSFFFIEVFINYIEPIIESHFVTNIGTFLSEINPNTRSYLYTSSKLQSHILSFKIIILQTHFRSKPSHIAFMENKPLFFRIPHVWSQRSAFPSYPIFFISEFFFR